MTNVPQITSPVSALPTRAGFRAGLLIGRLLLGTALFVGIGTLVVLAVGHGAAPRTPHAPSLTPAQQLLTLPGATVIAFPDYAVIAFPGAEQAGYGVSYEGEDHTVGTYLVAQATSHEQAQALADRYFARPARPIRGAGGALYASPRGNSDAWSYTYTGMVAGACSYGAGFVRDASFYQFQIVSSGLACQQAERHVGDWMDRMQVTS